MAERRTIVFTGRVQGVGFRMTTVHLAAGLKVTGTVRNLDEGGVELVATGETGEIELLLRRLTEHFGSFIRKMDQNSAPAADIKTSGIRVVS